MTAERDVIERLTGWAGAQPDIRAMLLTSSRGNGAAPVDRLSDYDVILAVGDPSAWAHDDGWQAALGRPLVRCREQACVLNSAAVTRMVIYEGGEALGYAYPHDLDRRMVQYLDSIHAMEHHDPQPAPGSEPYYVDQYQGILGA